MRVLKLARLPEPLMGPVVLDALLGLAGATGVADPCQWGTAAASAAAVAAETEQEERQRDAGCGWVEALELAPLLAALVSQREAVKLSL
jgi:hypothetical protein